MERRWRCPRCGREFRNRNQQVSSHLHVHTVKLAAPDDVDDELLNWFEEAFALRGAERG